MIARCIFIFYPWAMDAESVRLICLYPVKAGERKIKRWRVRSHGTSQSRADYSAEERPPVLRAQVQRAVDSADPGNDLYGIPAHLQLHPYVRYPHGVQQLQA